MTTLSPDSNRQSKAVTDSPTAEHGGRRLLWWVGVLASVGLVFGLQHPHTGFWQIGHGWTSVHGLALWTHAAPENGFVAYSQAWIEQDGSQRYEYFDRYPVFFSAAMNQLFRLTDDLSTEVYLFRQLMNVFFLLTMSVAYKLVRLLMADRLLAMGITLLSFSSYALLQYKDMMHYDQPALLVMLVLVYAIARWRQGARRWPWVLGAALLAVSVGRGYASFFVLGLWTLLETAERLAVARPWRARLSQIIRQPAPWVTLAALVWAGTLLGYNVAQEARIREVPVKQTSIVDSALRRLPGVGYAVDNSSRYDNEANQGMGAWGGFALVQTQRLARWALPARAGGEMPWRYQYVNDPVEVNPWRLGVGVALFGLAGLAIWRAGRPLRVPMAVLALSGVAWMFFMINLTTEHDYVTMYGVGLTLMAYVGLLGALERFRWAGALVLVAGVGLFGLGNWQVRQAVAETAPLGAAYTQDFTRVRGALPPGEHVFYLDTDFHRAECIIQDWQCFALGYYLGAEAYLTTAIEQAGYVLSPRPFYIEDPFVEAGAAVRLAETMTPQNARYHALRWDALATRTAPAAEAVAFRYGDRLQLQRFGVTGDVRLAPCEHITVESWWRATDAPGRNLNLQIVMVDADGGAVAEANAPLGSVPTRIWEVGMSTPDMRPLVVPCDTPPGEYPLIMGVYDPATVEPLAAFDAAGNEVGNQVYVTTLFVE